MKSLFFSIEKMRISLFILTLLLLSLPAQAATYTFPGFLPAGCVDNGGGSYNCGALTLAAGDTVTIAAPKPAKITFSGAFDTGSGVFISAGGSTSDLALVVNGAVTLGAGSLLNANVQTLGAGAVTIGADSWIGGNVSTETGFVVIGAATIPPPAPPTPQQTGVGGNVSTITGYVSMGAGSVINGSVTTQSAGYAVLGANAKVGGSIATLGAGYVTLGAGVQVSGSVTASGITGADYVTTGVGAIVGCGISTAGSYIVLGASTQVSGNLSTKIGYVTVGANSTVGGQISMNDPTPSYIGIGASSKVYAVCCNGSDASCVTDGSGIKPGPLVCVVPSGSTGSQCAVSTIPPTVAKSFSPASINTSGNSTLTVTLTNPNATAITDAAFTDTYPANLLNTATPGATTSCTGGKTKAAANGSALALSKGTIPANGSCTVTVTVTSATAGSYLNSTGPVTTSNAGTGTAATATLTVTSAAPGSFNAFESSTTPNPGAISGPIYTKLAGTAFGLDVVAIASGIQATGFSGNVKVELLVNTGIAGGGYGANNCPNSNSVIQTIASLAIAGGRSTVNFAAVAVAYRDVRVRISYPTTSPTATTCSTDSFAIRPTVFTITSTNASNSATSGTPVIKAGGGSFNLTATAVTGYDGTPSLDATKVVGSSTAGMLSGSFGAASSGVATGNTFTYSEVGNFGLNVDAVYDTSFTSIDQGSGCLASSTSSTLSGGKYGCWVGSNAVAQATGSSGFGRFIPDHFNTTVLLSGSVPMTCPTGLTCPVSYNGFVYAGQPFSVQVTAKNASDVTTVNYNTTTGFSKTTTLSPFGALGTTTAPTGAGALGVASVTAFAAGTLTEPAEKYTFSTIPTAPTAIYIRASDGEASSLRTSNPTTTSVEGGVHVVSGRINIPNVYGSERLALPMTATVQYYNGIYWIASLTDNVTAFNSNLTPGGNLVATVVSGLSSGVTVSSPGTSSVVAGVRTVTLAAPLVPGSANISLNAPTYLPSSVGRATFGIYKSPLIYRRENY